MKIIFLCPYPPHTVASQRFRFEQYLDLLTQAEHQYEIYEFASKSEWATLQSNANIFSKFMVLVAGFSRRIINLLSLPRFDFIFIHREVFPVGPPFLEWFIAKVARKKIIYDFDDSIWLTDKVRENWLEKLLRGRDKVSSICKWSYKVSAGNAYLASFASQFNSNTVVVPTTIDTLHLHNRSLYNLQPKEQTNNICIGWTGTYSTLKYLKNLEHVLQKIETKFSQISFLVIADQEPRLALRNVTFRKWKRESEIEDLLMADIGIMPLPNDKWSRGKCGFKALQYMALEIPAVASAVGVNTSIITHGKNGFCCTSDEEWFHALSMLIEQPELRSTLGREGRKRVIQAYSVESNSATFLSLFQL